MEKREEEVRKMKKAENKIKNKEKETKKRK